MSFNKKTKIILHLLGPLIFLYILFQIDYQSLFKEIVFLKWHFLILAFCLMILAIVLKALRWRILLSALSINLSWMISINLYWLGLFMGIITPGRLGELSRIYFLKNRGVDFFRSFFSVLLDRLTDILVLFLIGLIIAFFFLKEVLGQIIVLGIILILSVILIFLLTDQRSWLHRIFRRFLVRIFPADSTDFSSFSLAELWQELTQLKKDKIFYFLIYLIFSWFFYYLARYFTALSLGLELSFLNVTIITTLLAMVSILPISVAGLGTREAAAIYLFGLFNLNKEIAVLFSLLIFSIDLITLAFGLIPYFRESTLINKIKNE